jgi:hypothetical protein
MKSGKEGKGNPAKSEELDIPRFLLNKPYF